MSRHSSLPTAGSGAPEEQFQHAKKAYDAGGGHGEDIRCNGTGHGKVTKDVAPQHRRVTSASDINLKRIQMVEKKSQNAGSIPEPPADMDEAQRLTWQAQWADALQKVQSLRLSGAQSERWSGVATDIYRPKPQDSQANARNSHASSLDRWNYYPGPSVNRDSIPQPQPDHAVPNAGAGAWNKDFLSRPMSNRETEPGTSTGNLLKGRGSKSITSFGKLESPSTESIISDEFTAAEPQGRSSSTHSSTAFDQFHELPESFPALPTRVQRTQSHRYGRTWGQKPEANFSAAAPNPILKKAISMREGGAHQDAVLEMARAYSDTVCGVAKTLECASCGRNLGIIVQGNPGVDIAFCQACRPSPMQWKKPHSDPAAGSRKKKNVIVQFCRKMLRLNNHNNNNNHNNHKKPM